MRFDCSSQSPVSLRLHAVHSSAAYVAGYCGAVFTAAMSPREIELHVCVWRATRVRMWRLTTSSSSSHRTPLLPFPCALYVQVMSF